VCVCLPSGCTTHLPLCLTIPAIQFLSHPKSPPSPVTPRLEMTLTWGTGTISPARTAVAAVKAPLPPVHAAEQHRSAIPPMPFPSTPSQSEQSGVTCVLLRTLRLTGTDCYITAAAVGCDDRLSPALLTRYAPQAAPPAALTTPSKRWPSTLSCWMVRGRTRPTNRHPSLVASQHAVQRPAH
jgi:hypothetical protein